MPRPYVVGDSSPFLKRVLIPFWVIRIIIMAIQIALYALLIAGLGVVKDDLERLYEEYNTSLGYGAVLAVACVITAIILLCLILDIVCIVKRARRTLSPSFFLAVNIIQSIFYIANFALTMAGPRKGAVVIAISVVILLSFLGLLFYAAIIYHKYRTGSLAGTYVATVNPEMHKLAAKNSSYARISDTPAPLQFAYAPHGYPKTTSTYYDPDSVGRVAYEPFRPVASKTGEP